VGYSPHLLYVLIADRDGRIIVHHGTRRAKEARAERPASMTCSGQRISRFLTLYHVGQTYEVVFP